MLHSPIRITSTPRDAAPSANARESSGEESRMSWPITTWVTGGPGTASLLTSSANAVPRARVTAASICSPTSPRTS